MMCKALVLPGALLPGLGREEGGGRGGFVYRLSYWSSDGRGKYASELHFPPNLPPSQLERLSQLKQ